ncbi:uncharacterized protein LOC107263778 isoform X2 [Cephus cinctus]|uniref:Uncharacterized protein LOC107263778 isoform X2 n=1 Tax=Cephus cinctus TaxID=211228 RepID=A0AAJ7BIG2_CEPCN|nr:uncharacterized protein LOC107263778 isoform X2 [Cephus cinctus]
MVSKETWYQHEWKQVQLYSRVFTVTSYSKLLILGVSLINEFFSTSIKINLSFPVIFFGYTKIVKIILHFFVIMPLAEQLYCTQQINVPPRLPMILKQFCKAAIRTQPYDLLKWSSAYFRALAEGEDPPTKMRLEYPPPSTPSGLTLGFLKVLLRQFGDYNKVLSVKTILRRWECLCLDRKDFNLIMMIGKFRQECQVKKFLAIAAGLLTSSLLETMIVICELFTHESDGGSAMIPVTLFMEIYGYLAGLRCDGSERESFDEDLSDFVVHDSDQERSIVSARVIRLSSESDKIAIERGNSTSTQNTDININSKATNEDNGSVNEEDGVIDKTKSDIGNVESHGGEKLVLVDIEKENDKALVNDNKGINYQEETQISIEFIKENLNENEFSVKSLDKDGILKKCKSPDKSDLSIQRKRSHSGDDSTLLRYYPNIPGIGPRLSAEQIANVAIWMSDCARRQEGMVGPRNIRHFHCPPLGKQQIQDSEDDLSSTQ